MAELFVAGLVGLCVGLGLFLYALFGLFVAGRYLARRHRHRKADDLMALAGERCGAVTRATEPDHLWHACDHAAGHWDDARPLHHCRCGTHWANPLIHDREIARLNAMWDAPDYQHVPEEES